MANFLPSICEVLTLSPCRGMGYCRERQGKRKKEKKVEGGGGRGGKRRRGKVVVKHGDRYK